MEVFKNSLMKFIKPTLNSLVNVSDDLRIKIFIRFDLGLKYLREEKFKHNFQNNINLLCFCNLASKSAFYFCLRCQNFTNLRDCFMKGLQQTF